MGKYRCIITDPPWLERGSGKSKRGADRHYDLLSTKEIIDLLRRDILPLAADQCHLWMWVTNNFLEDGLEVIHALGFRYITNLVWVKDRVGLGQYLRGQHELLLLSDRGGVIL